LGLVGSNAVGYHPRPGAEVEGIYLLLVEGDVGYKVRVFKECYASIDDFAYPEVVGRICSGCVAAEVRVAFEWRGGTECEGEFAGAAYRFAACLDGKVWWRGSLSFAGHGSGIQTRVGVQREGLLVRL
jgi:hypothetical protein